MTEDRNEQIHLDIWNVHLTEELLFDRYPQPEKPGDIFYAVDRLGERRQLKLPSEEYVNDLRIHYKSLKQQAKKQEIIIAPSLHEYVVTQGAELQEAKRLSDIRLDIKFKEAGYFEKAYLRKNLSR